MITTKKELDEIRMMILFGYDPVEIMKKLVKEVIILYVSYFVVFGSQQAKILTGETKLLSYDNNS